MLRSLAVLLLVSLHTAAACAQDIDIRVEVDPRVELLGVVFRLAGNPEYTQGRVPEYAAAVDAYFQPHRRHAAVLMAQQLRRERSISFDAVMALAIHLDDALTPAPRRELDQDLSLYNDGRWAAQPAKQFIAALADFSHETNFGAFLKAHDAQYKQITTRMQTLISEHMDPRWFQAFFGVRPTAPFTVIPALLHGGANYGPKFIDAQGNEHLYAIIGIYLTDETGAATVSPDMLSTIVHEFNHSFVNHVVARHAAELERAGETMYPQVADQMRRQAYGNWRTMFNESLVRAAVVRYVHAHNDADAAAKEIAEQENQRGFLWMRDLAGLLGIYETQRERYTTFASYMPRVVEYFNGYAPNMQRIIAARQRAVAANRPGVLSIDPDLRNKSDVDPNTQQFTITFDRPMAGGYSFMRRGEAQGEFPEITKLTWADDNTKLIVDVSLKPGTRYAFALNASRGGAFQSRDGNVPLAELVVHFSTAEDHASSSR